MSSKPFRTVWTEEQISFLRENHSDQVTLQELTDRLNQQFNLTRDKSQVKSAVKNYKIAQGRRAKMSPVPRTMWPPHYLAFLSDNYPLMSRKELAKAFNEKFGLERTEQQIHSAVKNYKIRSGRTGHYPKGHVSWIVLNKGTGLIKPNSGSFKKGQTPANIKPLYHERVDENGYLLIKIPEKNPYTGAETRYQFKHVWLWEQAHGKVPKGMAVVYIDGDRSNCCLENLMLVSKQELSRLNRHGYSKMPAELKPVVKILAELEAKTFELRKKQGEK